MIFPKDPEDCQRVIESHQHCTQPGCGEPSRYLVGLADDPIGITPIIPYCEEHIPKDYFWDDDYVVVDKEKKN